MAIFVGTARRGIPQPRSKGRARHDVKLGIYMTVGPTHGIDLEFVGVDQIWILQALALHRI